MKTSILSLISSLIIGIVLFFLIWVFWRKGKKLDKTIFTWMIIGYFANGLEEFWLHTINTLLVFSPSLFWFYIIKSRKSMQENKEENEFQSSLN